MKTADYSIEIVPSVREAPRVWPMPAVDYSEGKTVCFLIQNLPLPTIEW